MKAQRKLLADVEAEKCLLGSIMLLGDVQHSLRLRSVMQAVWATDFSVQGHADIFAGCRELFESTQAIDPKLLASWLLEHGLLERIGGIVVLAECAEAVSTVAHLEHYADIVIRTARSRDLGLALGELAAKAATTADNETATDVIAKARFALAAAESRVAATSTSLKLADVVCEIADRYSQPEQVEAGNITLGLATLDAAIEGVEPGELVIMAARPSHGKTLCGLQVAHHWTALGLRTLIVSEEMTAEQLGRRTLQFASKLPREHWTDQPQELCRDASEFVAGRVDCIIAVRCQNINALAQHVCQAVDHNEVRGVIVDYLQLVRGAGRDRYEQVTHVSNTLKRLAVEHKVVVLGLCQLNRQVEGRSKFIPQLSDLKESGAIEQDADVVIGLVWPHAISKDKDPHEYQFFVLKNRNRGIRQSFVECRIEPSRQRIVSTNYVSDFE